MTHIEPNKFYIHTSGGLVKSGEDWQFIEWPNLIEVIYLEDAFEYGKGQWIEK